MRCAILLASTLLVGCTSKPVAPLPTADATPDPPTGSSTPTSTGTSTGSWSDLSVEVVDATWIAEVGSPASVLAEVRSSDPAPIEVRFTSDVSGLLDTVAPDAAGEALLVTDALPAGWHDIEVEAVQGAATAVDLATLGVCAWPALEDFATGASVAGWTLFGNAAWDPAGWLEITGNIQFSDGAIYKTDRKVNPGDVAIEFDIATGGGINTGADGFAVSVIDAPDEAALATIVNAAGLGGCLGYGTAGGCGAMPIDAFHIEFDTWDNPELGDPTPDNHVAVALDGDPAPLLWAPLPSLEDLAWRHVRVAFAGSDVTVWIDGAVVIQGTLPGFTFDGGYIGVSGATGWATNFHRFDNLQLYDQCLVPDSSP